MRNTMIIAAREYWSRVRKRSFLIMTILGPVLIAGFYGLLIFLMLDDQLGQTKQSVMVYDQSGIFEERLESTDFLAYHFVHETPDLALVQEGDYIGWITVPRDLDVHTAKGIVFSSDKDISLQEKERMNAALGKALKSYKLELAGISQGMIDSLQTAVSVESEKVTDTGEIKKTSSELYTVLGLVLAFAIYMFIFLYGVQVMRGVIQEKTSRIVEIIVSSVRPFQLMMGKVVGIALVGLTQLLIWLVLSGALIMVISIVAGSGTIDPETIKEMGDGAITGMEGEVAEGPVQDLMSAFYNLNFPFLFFMFIFYFLGGYLLYSALFAAIGAAVDSETDTQQFMMPVTIPLVFAIALSSTIVLKDPNGTVAIWLSMIPLTSPIAMMVRLPFLSISEHWMQITGSVLLLILFFTFVIWFAGRIYRVGILMYGKKATLKELIKWMRYKT